MISASYTGYRLTSRYRTQTASCSCCPVACSSVFVFAVNASLLELDWVHLELDCAVKRQARPASYSDSGACACVCLIKPTPCTFHFHFQVTFIVNPNSQTHNKNNQQPARVDPISNGHMSKKVSIFIFQAFLIVTIIIILFIIICFCVWRICI